MTEIKLADMTWPEVLFSRTCGERMFKGGKELSIYAVNGIAKGIVSPRGSL